MKKLTEQATKIVIYLMGILTLSLISVIFITLFMKGYAVISWEFLTTIPTGSPLGTAGGIFPAIVGTFSLGIFASFIGGTIGILVALWLVYYGKGSILSNLMIASLNFLSGIPSIILGLVGYTFLIVHLGLPRSLLSAGLTISVMILPFIGIRAIKIFEEEEKDYLKQALALGISKEQTILTLILPNCFIDLIGTLFIGMAYGMGATAPVMYTGAVMFAALPVRLEQPFMSLPNHLYQLVSNGISYDYAYGTALVLIILLLGIQLFCHLCQRLLVDRRS